MNISSASGQLCLAASAASASPFTCHVCYALSGDGCSSQRHCPSNDQQSACRQLCPAVSPLRRRSPGPSHQLPTSEPNCHGASFIVWVMFLQFRAAGSRNKRAADLLPRFEVMTTLPTKWSESAPTDSELPGSSCFGGWLNVRSGGQGKWHIQHK